MVAILKSFVESLSEYLSINEPELFRVVESISLLEDNDTYHISLSKIFSLPHHILDSFQETLKLRSRKIVDPFWIQIDYRRGLECLYNPEKNKLFITCPISIDEKRAYASPLHILVKDLIDPILMEHKLPLFYDPPKFHQSLASITIKEGCLLTFDESEAFKSSITEICNSLWKKFATELSGSKILEQYIDEIHLRMGGRKQQSVRFPLSLKKSKI